MVKIIIILLIAGSVIGSLIYSSQEPAYESDNDPVAGVEEDLLLEVPESVAAQDPAIVAAELIDVRLADAAQTGTPIVFFHASWCPTCRALEAELQERADDIPGGVNVVIVDYDDEGDLRRRYDVTRQHTLVLLDSNLNPVKSWEGGGVDRILAEVQG